MSEKEQAWEVGPAMSDAAKILATERDRLARAAREEVERLAGHQLYNELLTTSGDKFGVETTAMWDDEARGPVRVVIDVFKYEPQAGWTAALASGVFLKLLDGSVQDA